MDGTEFAQFDTGVKRASPEHALGHLCNRCCLSFRHGKPFEVEIPGRGESKKFTRLTAVE